MTSPSGIRPLQAPAIIAEYSADKKKIGRSMRLE